MYKRIIAGLIILFSTSLLAQNVENDPSINDTIATKTHKSNIFKSIYDFVISDYDPKYVSPNKYDLAFMTTYYNNNEYYSIRSTDPKSQTLRFSPRPSNKIGFYFGWRFIFLGWSFDVNDLFNKTKGKNNGTSFELSLYSPKFGIDLMYLKTGNDYKIHKAKGFDNALPPGYSVDFDGLNVDVKAMNLYYMINNKKFSYQSAYSQTTVQRVSCGSGIIGFSVSTHNLHFDYEKLPYNILSNMNDDMKINHIKYTNISLSAGYTYSWVFARNFLANISASPIIAYKVSKTSSLNEPNSGFFKKFNIDLLLRAGVVYNNGKYFVGSSFLGRNYGYKQKGFSLNNGYGTLQVYAGFNFLLKKEYRQEKKKNKYAFGGH